MSYLYAREYSKPILRNCRPIQHVTELVIRNRRELQNMASEVAAAAANAVRRTTKEMHGIVVSAGLMDKTVKVRLGGLRWEPRVQKVSQTSRPVTTPAKTEANWQM